MNKKIKIALCCLFTFIICGGVFAAGFFIGRGTYDSDMETLNYIISMYKQYYYEETDDIIGVVTDSLLDSYSDYYTKEEYDLILAAAKGNREGIGISYNATTNVISLVLGNSPAKKAGVKADGKIVSLGLTEDTLCAVDEENTLSSLLGAIDSYTDFIMKVDYDGVIESYTLQKQEYTQTYVFYYDASGEYGFTDSSGTMEFVRLGDNEDYDFGDNENAAMIKYSGFSGTQSGLYGSAGQMTEALKKFRESGKTCLILDLRGNGGGYMSILSEVSSHFIGVDDGSKVLVSYAVDKNGIKTSYYSGQVDYGTYGYEKIVVLADENSASASEALMGAILDYDENNIVNIILESSLSGGEVVYKSYGKGIMQTTFTRITGEAIKLTTAKIYWPVTNISIHGVGLTPSLDSRILAETSEGAFYDALSLFK